MKEFKAIQSAYHKMDKANRMAALATVVKVRGSSYRSPGARMLITDDGRWVGSISGGCLEGDALRKARMVMKEKKAITVTYDTREESNQNLGIGLGCNGVIDVLIEPIDQEASNNPVHLFDLFSTSKEPVAIATVFNSKKHNGEKIILSGNVLLHQSIADSEFAKHIVDDLSFLITSGKSDDKIFGYDGERVEVFMELLQPTISMIIFGGGFDARPVSQLAKSLGWDVTVTDECSAHIAPIFFPDADNLSLCQRQYIDRDFPIDAYTACVLMSHNYEYDRDVLRKLIGTEASYIGILGPRKRFDRMILEFSKENINLSSDQYHRIHSPIGLDIGAETPDEIAISIIAEIQGKFANRSGGFLKYRSGPIHHRDTENDQVFRQVYMNPSSPATQIAKGQ